MSIGGDCFDVNKFVCTGIDMGMVNAVIMQNNSSVEHCDEYKMQDISHRVHIMSSLPFPLPLFSASLHHSMYDGSLDNKNIADKFIAGVAH